MAYKVAMTKNKENFAEVIEESREIRSSGSLLKITGESGDTGDGACRESLDTAPLCWNCNTPMTPTPRTFTARPWRVLQLNIAGIEKTLGIEGWS